MATQPDGDDALPRDDQWTVSDEVRHDVVNALTAALGYVQLLRHRLPTRSHAVHQDFEALSAIEANMAHAVHLLRGEPRHRQTAEVDMVALVREAAAQVPAERAGDVVVQWSGELTPVGFWDPLAVSRILANLLDNAAKYSRSGTPIVVALATDDTGIEFIVRDRGIGVPEVELEAIFAGYRSEVAQAMAPGHGLGLSSSRRLAEDLSGRLWATREPGGGTAVHLWLPGSAPENPNSRPR